MSIINPELTRLFKEAQDSGDPEKMHGVFRTLQQILMELDRKINRIVKGETKIYGGGGGGGGGRGGKSGNVRTVFEVKVTVSSGAWSADTSDYYGAPGAGTLYKATITHTLGSMDAYVSRYRVGGHWFTNTSDQENKTTTTLDVWLDSNPGVDIDFYIQALQ